MHFERQQILVYCKTYPELSFRHSETVCTAGVLLPSGRPIRLYPVPLRLLPEAMKYQLYDIVEVPVARNLKDPRPESHRIRPDQIARTGRLGTELDWEERRRYIFADSSWHYDCLESLKRRQREGFHSLGIIEVAEVTRVTLESRSDDDRRDYDRRIRHQRAVLDLFSTEERIAVDFLPFRVRVAWRCGRPGYPVPGCPGHTAGVLDWGLLQLGRREGAERARQKMEALADLTRYELRLFVGNFFTHQQTFGIIGMWYPQRRGWKDQLPLAFGG